MRQGYYFMFEGGEGCGKDTQADLFCNWLIEKGYEVINTKEPGGTPESEQIRKILLEKENKLDSITELFLYQAARKDLNKKIILPSIKQGKIVISKRGFPSTYAYQGFGGGVNSDLIQKLNEVSMKNIMPNLLFIIDINPSKGLEKEVKPDRFAKKGLEYHQNVREGYLNLAKKYSEFAIVIPYQENKVEEMQQEIRNITKERFNI